MDAVAEAFREARFHKDSEAKTVSGLQAFVLQWMFARVDDRALQSLRGAIRTEPDRVALKALYALALAETGRVDEAVDESSYLRDALSSLPDREPETVAVLHATALVARHDGASALRDPLAEAFEAYAGQGLFVGATAYLGHADAYRRMIATLRSGTSTSSGTLEVRGEIGLTLMDEAVLRAATSSPSGAPAG